ncbi:MULTISPECIES: DUF6113 family protein [unclassified Streptomyces]|uniref:DUF6113 family protein n=1 Tax=unclassified Streptomyces TaxID=2593676 RepID=UPI000DB99D19|nr:MULTISPECIES: DUF6113 family protein [unclassified Streptomyces]MYT75991.1 hypothetical protein [Streptomyces sp. SID8367]RAJ77824.1 hypothetical protein K377_05748 [Streptomyces sp. PsTaAH-137]
MTSNDRTRAQGGSALAQPLDLRIGRIAALVGLLVLGALVGVAGALAQGGWFPGGLLLALLGAAGVFHGGARLTGGRAGAVAPAAGWLVAVMLLTTSRPEGDFLFGAGLGSYLFLLGGMAVAVICATIGLPGQPPVPAARLGK